MSCCKGWLVGGAVVLFCLVWLGWSGCDKRPTRPEPPPPQPKDYPVYFCNQANSTLWIFHPLSRKLDSMVTPYDGVMRGVTVSADGQLLYFSQADRVLVVDSDSLGLVAELPYEAWWGTAVSPDNNLLAIMGHGISILRTQDWSVVFADTIDVYRGVFSRDSRTFYACSAEGWDYFNSLCWVEPLDDNPVLQHKEFYNHVTQVRPTPDGSKLLLNLLWHFVVYDIAGDTILTDIELWPGQGNLEITPDGKYAFFSNPSTMLGERGTTDLYVFDVLVNSVVDTLDLDVLGDSISLFIFGIGEMAVTPDGRWLAAHDSPSGTDLFLYDLSLPEAVFHHDFGSNHCFLGISTVKQEW